MQPAEALPSESRLEIFLIDDDDDARFVTGRYLKKYFADARILEFANAEDALAAMQLRRPRAIVTDYLLPGMKGIPFVQEIRALDSRVPIVMLTGMDPIADEARSAGVNVFLTTSAAADLGKTLQRLLCADDLTWRSSQAK